jgi:single-stranded DNA-binding protein
MLAGRLKSDMVRRAAKDGASFFSFTLFIDEYKLVDEKWQKTRGEIDLITNEAKVKGIEKDLVKDALVGIEGRIAQNNWTGKDEKTHSNLLVRIQSITLLEKDGSGGESFAGRADAEDADIDAAALGL